MINVSSIFECLKSGHDVCYSSLIMVIITIVITVTIIIIIIIIIKIMQLLMRACVAKLVDTNQIEPFALVCQYTFLYSYMVGILFCNYAFA